jgi:hypothetical protein
MALFNIPRLQNYRRLGLNVLIAGHAGIGKTAVINEVFAGLKWKYFSAPTMDPWVDLVGVPRAISDEKRGGMVLDLVRPEFVKADDIEAIFIDELNRAPDKVLNALMELIQFKSINGHPLKNLKVIWAAINPDDDSDEYAVNKLDRALKDRFQVHLEIPFKIDEEYFNKKYPEIGASFCAWWNDLPDDLKKEISPRRLDYAAQAYLDDCHLADFLPARSNIQKLKKSIKALPFVEQLLEIETEVAAKTFLRDINNATKLLQLVTHKNPEALAFFEKFKKIMPQELIDALAPAVEAAAAGVRATTLAELLPSLDRIGKIGEVEITHAINEPAFVYASGSLQEDVARQIRVNSAAFRKLVSHIVHVMTKASEPTLKKAMLKSDGTRTNLVTIAMHIAQADTTMQHFTKEERKKINAHTYLLKCAASKWM